MSDNIRGPWQWRGRHLIDGNGRTVLKIEPSNALADELAAIAAVPEMLALLHEDVHGHDCDNEQVCDFCIHRLRVLEKVEAATWLPPVDTKPAAK